MSVEIENSINYANVDVDDQEKGNGSKSEFSSDSGIDTSDSHLSKYELLSESPTNCVNGAIVLKEKSEYLDASQTQTIEDFTTDISSNSDDGSINDMNSDNDTDNMIVPKESISICEPNIDLNDSDLNQVNSVYKEDLNSDMTKLASTDQNIQNHISDRTLRASTNSLNEHAMPDNNFKFKSNSRSAENILSIIENNMKNTAISSGLKEDEILSQFKNQKQKVSAAQKIITETQQNFDSQYRRIPKDIQDISIIVKNVHGIFSSVGGSLMNVYNNTHKTTNAKLTQKKICKIHNGNVMNEIFEEVPNESNVEECLDTNQSSLIKENITNSNTCLDMESIMVTPTENSADISDTKGDLNKLQVESLERVLLEQRRENTSLKEKIRQHMNELQIKDQTFKELETKLDLMCKRAEQAQKEKDAAVMRYASTECAAIEAKKAAEIALKAEKAAYTERDLLTSKLRVAREEKQRICQLYDDKCHELQNAEREASKVKEELREVEGRLKWTQSKLRMEMDAYKECTERAEKLSQQVTELEAARETATANASDSIRARQLEGELKEIQAALIMCRHDKEDFERRLSAALLQLECCRRERDDALESLAKANTQVGELKESNLRLEEEAAELAALRARAALADSLASQLERESERASQAEEALAEERARADTCARREAAALEHAAHLTAEHVAERAAAHDERAKVQALSVDNASLRERVASLEAVEAQLRRSWAEEEERRNRENKIFARKVAELTEEVKEANKRYEWEQGENNVLKKKHSSTIKEMNRELQRALKRIQQLEARVPRPADADSTRTGSVSSLSSSEGAPSADRASSDVPTVEQAREPDRQALIERIVALQRAAARRAERCDFLEEHARALTAELRGKSKLLRRLLPTIPPAQLAPSAADGAKQEIARLGGGAMAAVWGGDPEGMTFELSLEMNKRLQGLLEDTLLKNITLKENVDTLGEEIARLKAQKNIK